MEVWVNSATKAEDYTWRTVAGSGPSLPPVQVTSGFEQWKFEDGVPWYGLVFQDETAALYFGNLKTDREDTRGRPIFVHAVIRTASNTECLELRESMASLLVREKESLAQWLDYLLRVFDGNEALSLPGSDASASVAEATEPIGRFAYPREDVCGRESVARAILSVGCDQSFVVGVTGRSGTGIFERVCNSDPKWQVAFFSGMCTVKTQLQPKRVASSDFHQSPFQFNRTGVKIAGAVIVAIILCAIVRSCSKKESVSSEKSAAELQNIQSCTNLPPKAAISCATKLPALSDNLVVTNRMDTIK